MFRVHPSSDQSTTDAVDQSEIVRVLYRELQARRLVPNLPSRIHTAFDCLERR